MLTRIQLGALVVLYELARADCPADLGFFAYELELSCGEADRLLLELASLGLVDADRIRLTLPGLAIAVSWCARARRAKSLRSQQAAA